MKYPFWIRVKYNEFGDKRGYLGSVRNKQDLVQILVRMNKDKESVESFQVNGKQIPIEVLESIFEEIEKVKGEDILKKGKRPTRAQKDMINNGGLNPNDWLVVKNLQHELQIVNCEIRKICMLVV